jgi:hypothetical protein
MRSRVAAAEKTAERIFLFISNATTINTVIIVKVTRRAIPRLFPIIFSGIKSFMFFHHEEHEVVKLILNLNSPLLAAQNEFKFQKRSLLRRKCDAEAGRAEAKIRK